METRIINNKQKPKVTDLRTDILIAPQITGFEVSVSINDHGEMKEYNEIK